MKNEINLFRTVFLTLVFFFSINSAFSQARSSKQQLQELPTPAVAIKAYEKCKNVQDLVVYNPYQHSFNYYQNSPYSVRWYQDGKLVGFGSWLYNVCGQNFTAVVTNEEAGWSDSISYYMGCRPVSYD